MKRLLVVGLLLLGVPVWAATFTSTQSGNWHDGTTWGNSGTGLTCPNANIPCSGDQVLLANTFTVTCEASQTCSAGTYPLTDLANFAIDCTATNGTGVLVVNGTLNMQGPVRQCNANWTFAPGSALIHDNSGISSNVLTVSSQTVAITSNVGSITVTNTVTQGQTIVLAGFADCGATGVNGTRQVQATGTSGSAIAFPLTGANCSATNSGTVTIYPHYEWQVCAVAGSCANSLLTMNGSSGSHVAVSNNSTFAYPLNAFGGTSNGRTDRRNTADSYNYTTGAISGAGAVSLHYVDTQDWGVPGGKGGKQSITVAMSLSSSNLTLDHFLCYRCTSVAMEGGGNHVSSSATFNIEESFLGSEPVDGLSVVLFGKDNGAPGAGWLMKNTNFSGTSVLVYNQIPCSHCAFIAPHLSGAFPPINSPALYSSASFQDITDSLLVGNGQGLVSGTMLFGNLKRFVMLNINGTGDCDLIRGNNSVLPSDWEVSGGVIEAWSASGNYCGTYGVGAAIIPSTTANPSTLKIMNFYGNLGIPKLSGNANAAYFPPQASLVTNEISNLTVTNIQVNVYQNIWPAGTVAKPEWLDTVETPGDLGAGAGTQTYNNIVGGFTTGTAAYINKIGVSVADGTYTSDHNGIFNSTTTGSGIYNANAAAYTTTPGTGDFIANPNFMDTTRNQLTWAQLINGVTYTGYDYNGASEGPQIKWQLYQCTNISICKDADGNAGVWDSHWDWTNAYVAPDTKPACYPNCYREWARRGFTVYNQAYRGSGRNGADMWDSLFNPAILNN